jgi:dTDP-4-amino-4,6-dideoxygalactose transaminase
VKYLSERNSKIIGGMFGIGDFTACNDNETSFLQGDSLLLVNARSCINYVLESMAPGTVWLPSYLCESVFTITSRFKNNRYYPVNYDLSVDDSWISSIQRNDLVILIDYFGFKCRAEIKQAIKSKGAWLLEDASQALLSSITDGYTDFLVYSPRKYVGVPDGGILKTNNNLLMQNRQATIMPPSDWWEKAYTAAKCRREFDSEGGENTWFMLFREVENDAPTGKIAMSDFSQRLLKKGFDYRQIAEIRRSNFNCLLEKLDEYAIYHELPAGVVPLGYPCTCRNRDQVIGSLYEQQIFPPVHWSIKGFVPEEFTQSHALSKRIMTLPCDQRYDSEDMNRIADAFLKVAHKC